MTGGPTQIDQNGGGHDDSVSSTSSPHAHVRTPSLCVNFFAPASINNTVSEENVASKDNSSSDATLTPTPTPPPYPKPNLRCGTIHEKSGGNSLSSKMDTFSDRRPSYSFSQNERRDSNSSNGHSDSFHQLNRVPSDEFSVSRLSADSDCTFSNMTSPSRISARASFSVGNTPMLNEKKICKYPGCRSFIAIRNAPIVIASSPEEPSSPTCESPRINPMQTNTIYCLRHMYKHVIPDVSSKHPRRWAALYEVLTTEESYVTSLRNCQLEYLRRLEVLVELGIPIISQDDINRIFKNLNNIIDVNGQFLDDLRDLYGSKDEQTILEAFPLILQHYTPLFSVYRNYLETFDSAAAHAHSLVENNHKFAELVSTNTKILRLNLHDFLIMPVQRLPRYVLLLKEISRSLTDADAVLSEYQQTLDVVSQIATTMNKSLDTQEHEVRLAAFMSKVEQDERYFDLAAPGRRILLEGVLKIRNSDDKKSSAFFYFVLFTDMLVYFIEKKSLTKKVSYKMRHILFLDEMLVTPIPGPNKKDKDILIEANNKDGKKKRYEISCGSPENRNIWIAALMKAIVANAKKKQNDSTLTGNSKKLSSMLGN